MPDLAVTGVQPLALWTAVALLFLLLVISVVAVRRSGSFGSVAALFGAPALVVIAWSAWNFADQSILQRRLMEREALNARALQLTTAALAPGSVLGCLDAGASEALEGPCEAAIFAKPETVAAAIPYVEAKLHLLADSLDYAHRVDQAYYSTISQLRRAIETDRYGFVAYILMTRDGCTADSCGFFPRLREARAVKANMTARTLENSIARHAANWSAQKSSPVAGVSRPEPSPTTIFSPPVTKPIDFPTAASIPPVSIMTEPPAAPPSSSAEAAPPAAAPSAPPVRRPPANANGNARTAPAPPATAARPQ
jgi:hypothetical protein